jgi:hypothetical protein
MPWVLPPPRPFRSTFRHSLCARVSTESCSILPFLAARSFQINSSRRTNSEPFPLPPSFIPRLCASKPWLLLLLLTRCPIRLQQSAGLDRWNGCLRHAGRNGKSCAAFEIASRSYILHRVPAARRRKPPRRKRAAMTSSQLLSASTTRRPPLLQE